MSRVLATNLRVQLPLVLTKQNFVKKQYFFSTESEYFNLEPGKLFGEKI